jgi:hypothetical protein
MTWNLGWHWVPIWCPCLRMHVVEQQAFQFSGNNWTVLGLPTALLTFMDRHFCKYVKAPYTVKLSSMCGPLICAELRCVQLFCCSLWVWSFQGL